MHQLKSKYSINIKPSQQSYTIKSVLQPDLSSYQVSKISIIWYRQPPPPYQVQELTFNFNERSYKCSSLDYECSIVCKIVNQNGKQEERFDYGPIETFVYNRLSTCLQLRVQVLLFGVWKKCVFTFNSSPTLINPQNNNKYQLTQQDIRSIYLKPQSLALSQQSNKKQFCSDQLSVLNNQFKKIIVVENLFQRLILLKLFHQIPNGMYCYSMEVLEMAFYDQSACNTTLLAINRFKYQKKQLSQVTKSMYSQPSQQLSISKFMKKSNDSLSHGKNDLQSTQSLKTNSQDTLKKQFLPLSAFCNWRKYPKQSINSANQSIVSGNSSKANQSRASLIPRSIESKNVDENDKQGLASQGSSQLKSRISIKQPKISILSTDINSTKQPRQQKVSFPEAPVTQTLKSSQLLIKPKQFKSALSLRRSQDQIKTPRMDADEENLNSIPSKRKNASEIEGTQKTQEQEEQSKYVNQFQNLLFQVDEDQNKQTELCLNDSFAKMQEEQEKQKMKISQPILDVIQFPAMTQSIIQQITPPSPSKSQRNVLNIKQTLASVLQQNYQLKLKNEELKKQISDAKSNGDKKNDISKYEEDILKMKEIQQVLINEIQVLKKSVILTNSRMEKSYTQNSKCKVTQKQTQNSLIKQQQAPIRSQITAIKPQFYPSQKLEFNKYSGCIFSPPRQSKNANDTNYKYPEQSNSSFMVRRSQQHDPSSFINKETQEASPNSEFGKINIFNSGDLKFLKFRSDPDYQKFRNNQSYSYKQSEPIKFEQKREVRQYPYKY